MAIVIDNTSSYVGSVSGTDHSGSITLSVGTNRKIIVCGCVEIGSAATLSATFDGNSMTERASGAHTAGTELKLYFWTYDVSDGTGSGSKTITITSAVAGTAVSWFAWQISGAAAGVPEYASVTEASNAVSVISQSSVTVAEGSAIFAGGNNSSATPTYNTWAGVTERQENNETAYTTAFSDSTGNTAGTKTVSVTMSATSGNKLLGVISVAEATTSTLSDIDTDEQVYSEQAVQLKGTGLSAGTSLTYKGISASLVTSTSSLSIRATFPNFFTNGIKLGKDFPFIAGASTLTVSTTSRLNWKYTVIGTPDTSTTANLAYGLSLSTSDIIVFPKYLMSNGVTTSYTLTISTDSSFIADVGGVSGSYSFQYFIWDESTSDYGTTATYGLNYSSTGGVTPLAVGNIWQWIFQTETSTGGMTDKVKVYLAAQGYTGATNEALFNWLGSLGYTGALADRISQFERANTTRYG